MLTMWQICYFTTTPHIITFTCILFALLGVNDASWFPLNEYLINTTEDKQKQFIKLICPHLSYLIDYNILV